MQIIWDKKSTQTTTIHTHTISFIDISYYTTLSSFFLVEYIKFDSLDYEVSAVILIEY